MCLDLLVNWKATRTMYRLRKQPMLLYKMLNYDQFTKKYTSINEKQTWTLHQINTSTRSSTSVTPKEEADLKIEEGFHFFISPVDAKSSFEPVISETGDTNYRLCKFIIQPIDVVAVGVNDRWPNVVATRCTFIGEDR